MHFVTPVNDQNRRLQASTAGQAPSPGGNLPSDRYLTH